jgi:hypothetical protein
MLSMQAHLDAIDASPPIIGIGGPQVHLHSAGPADGEHAAVGGGGVHGGAVQIYGPPAGGFSALLPPSAVRQQPRLCATEGHVLPPFKAARPHPQVA